MSDVHALVGLYVLDALDDPERRRFEQHLATCEDCRREVDGLHEAVAELAVAESVPAPPDLRPRVMAEVAVTRQERPVVHAGVWQARRWLPLIVAAAAVLVIAVLATALVRTRQDANDLRQVAAVLTAPDARTVALQAPSGVIARYVASASTGRAVLLADGLPPVGADRTYQLWYLDKGGPRSAGVFVPGDDGRVEAVVAAPPPGASGLGITEEPAGGSPAPTGTILVSGSLVTT